jgi:hypothetical protein
MSTSGSGERDITPREVLEELKCPVCDEYMTPPIPMCQNGHNICNTCRQRVNQCPTCRQQFLQSRCWLLENIIQKMKRRCQYYEEGCKFVSTSQFVKSHEADCPDRPFDCPFSVVVTKNFCWRGHISYMWAHMVRHETLSLQGEGKFVFTVDCAQPVPLHRALHARDENFFLVCRVINMDLYCCVLYVGPQESASQYTYWVTILTRDGFGYAKVCLPTKSYLADVETLFRNRDCAVFSYVMWNRCRCVYSSTVSCEVEIPDDRIPAFKIRK